MHDAGKRRVKLILFFTLRFDWNLNGSDKWWDFGARSNRHQRTRSARWIVRLVKRFTSDDFCLCFLKLSQWPYGTKQMTPKKKNKQTHTTKKWRHQSSNNSLWSIRDLLFTDKPHRSSSNPVTSLFIVSPLFAAHADTGRKWKQRERRCHVTWS